jgi:hypothetical protein
MPTESGQRFHRRPAGDLTLGQRREVALGGLREKIYDVVEVRRLPERVTHLLSLAEASFMVWVWRADLVKVLQMERDRLRATRIVRVILPWEAGTIVILGRLLNSAWKIVESGVSEHLEREER